LGTTTIFFGGGKMEEGKLTSLAGNTMNGAIGSLSQIPTSIVFRVGNNQEILKLDPNGDIYVKGNLVDNDKEVVEALREYLKGVGML
jgi:hypothetical protein